MASLKTWLLATRPKTLSASIIPVSVGASLAFRNGMYDTFYFMIVLVCALLIQIITNYINEIYDFKKGADTEDRLGPKRAVAAGEISPSLMKIVSSVLLVLCFSLGLILVNYAGIEILAIGIISLFFAWAYTGGPYPLAYKGLGDLFVFIFFGVLAVAGTYYVFTQEIDISAITIGSGIGFLSMNILGVNNIRDIETDVLVDKITMAVRLGKRKAQAMYVILNMMAYAVTLLLFINLNSFYMLLPLLSLPLAVILCMHVYSRTGKALNKTLALTGVQLVIYGILACIGFII